MQSFLTPAEAAGVLQVRPRTLLDWAEGGSITPSQRSEGTGDTGRRRDDINALAARNGPYGGDGEAATLLSSRRHSRPRHGR